MSPSQPLATTRVAVQTEDFDLAAEYAALRDAQAASGAVVTFTGLVRDLVDDPLQQMVLEHYPGMTESSLETIVAQARSRWPLYAVTVIHRVGTLYPADQIVFVGVSSAHRTDAFAACEFIMDYLKKDAPFWKKEVTRSREHWVEQKSSDLDAAERWD